MINFVKLFSDAGPRGVCQTAVFETFAPVKKSIEFVDVVLEFLESCLLTSLTEQKPDHTENVRHSV